MRKWQLVFLYFAGLMLLGYTGGRILPASGPADIPADADAPEIKFIALTFDDGPRRATTEKLLDGLRERGASATFFVVGEEIEENQDLIQRMAAEGHQVGNHTWSHVRLTGTSASAIAQEIGQTDAALHQLLGEDVYWLRPPYGLVDEGATIPVPMVKWSVDPRDWESRNKDAVVQAVLGAAKPNDIILLHDIYPTSVEAALEIVDSLQAEGYWFVTVEELLFLNNITPQAGEIYRKG